MSAASAAAARARFLSLVSALRRACSGPLAVLLLRRPLRGDARTLPLLVRHPSAEAGAAAVPPPPGLAALALLLCAALPLHRGSTLYAEGSFYEILGVDRNATQQEIKKAYKRSALKNHPDKAPDGEREAYEERFKTIARAYEVLSDPDKRRIYDVRGPGAFEGNDASGPGGPGSADFGAGMDPFDRFRSMFGSNFGFSNGSRRTPDVGYAMEVTLEEVYKGSRREVKYDRDVVCRKCQGRGATRLEHCNVCHGSGVTTTTRNVGGFYMQTQSTCSACNGQGVHVPPGAQCQACSGRGYTQREVKLDVNVPPNCQDGERFVFRGQADESPGMEAGDIIIELREKPHAVFSRLGSADLFMKRRVSLLDALTGVQFTVRHLDGSDVEVSCPAGAVVRPGDLWVVKGRGMRSSGDLVIQFEVDFPEKLPGAGSATESREQLRPLLDPSAPAAPGGVPATGGFRGLFGFGGGGDGGQAAARGAAAAAERTTARRQSHIKELLADREFERQVERRQRHSHRGGGDGGGCQQM